MMMEAAGIEPASADAGVADPFQTRADDRARFGAGSDLEAAERAREQLRSRLAYVARRRANDENGASDGCWDYPTRYEPACSISTVC
jgi:hypothetical protein